MSPAAGDEIGHYRFLEQIGSGCFSTVWKARHLLTEIDVAVKCVDKSELTQREDHNRFVQEISVLKQARHPFIAEFFELIEDSKFYYVVLELARRGSLLDFVNSEGALSESHARVIFGQLVSALDYLHNTRSIAHLDLKAENILLDTDNTIRVTDFGFSRAFSGSEASFRTPCGSLQYVAPEIARGQPYSKAADVWSAGVILYAMVTGYLPFRVDVPEGAANYRPLLFEKITEADPTFPGEMSPKLMDLLQSLLTKSPKARWPIEKVVGHPWLAGVHMPANRVPNFVDMEALAKLTALKMDVKQIEIDILRDEFTPGTAMYRSLVREKLAETLRNERVVTTSQSAPKLLAAPPGATIDKRRKSMGGFPKMRSGAGAKMVQVVAQKSRASPIQARLAPVFAAREPGKYQSPI